MATAPYIFQAFPKHLYSPDGKSRVVDNPDEEAELLEDGWADSPAAFEAKVETKRERQKRERDAERQEQGRLAEMKVAEQKPPENRFAQQLPEERPQYRRG